MVVGARRRRSLEPEIHHVSLAIDFVMLEEKEGLRRVSILTIIKTEEGIVDQIIIPVVMVDWDAEVAIQLSDVDMADDVEGYGSQSVDEALPFADMDDDVEHYGTHIADVAPNTT
ncbi:hypothetical protein J5N97_013402 [Dioscorea zingiberensis]|uniref:Uncharacterized protein n=1 Tax=Dioscorea zingiberensis TaxID=325984 RepID=A0A9D5HIS4_9LILI|nr:hypothetical protein J5N97_013402 [Dioscorea zingiberensis]